jgi:carbon storage regulator
MLVLTRKAKQQIQIGPDITITILQIKGQAVRVGIEAPRSMSVLRTEIAAKMPEAAHDATVQAAMEKLARENKIPSRRGERAISSPAANEDKSGRTQRSADGSLRCRAPRVEVAPVNSPYQTTDPASFFALRRRRRLAVR